MSLTAKEKEKLCWTAKVVQVSEIGYLKWDWSVFWDQQIILVTLNKTYRKHFMWFVSESFHGYFSKDNWKLFIKLYYEIVVSIIINLYLILS